MRWRDTVKLFQMAGSDRGGQRGLVGEMRMGRRETQGPAERERVFSTQIIINSESHHGMDESHQNRMLEEPHNWTQMDGKVQGDLSRKCEVIRRGAIMFRTMALNSMTEAKFFGLKECCRREEIGNTFIFSSTKIKKKCKCIVEVDCIAHRK